ncbi:MAG: RHS repeat-associated core domain-containing protein [Pseudomonadota bacterium]
MFVAARSECAAELPQRTGELKPSLSLLLVALLLTATFEVFAIGVKGIADVIYADSFEGESISGGRISGQVLFDPDGDGDLSDGEPRSGVRVYLDANFNARLDPGERVTSTAADGTYAFLAVETGIHHVRQLLDAPNLQTLPSGGVRPALNRLPDEIVDYVHAAPGVGDFDSAYGREASDWPGEWSRRDPGPMPRLVSSLDMLLEPIGVRNVNGVLGPSYGAALLCLPTEAAVTLRFDEPIIDGDGPDLLVYSLNRGSAGEEVELRVGTTLDDLRSAGVFSSRDRVSEVDLAALAPETPIYYVQAIGQDDGGSWKGFELVGIEAVNFAQPAADAYIVTVTAADPVHENKDFGRFAQDLPPTLTLGITDNEPATPELRPGETVTIEVAAFDDVAVSSLTLSANGQLLVLDAAGATSYSLTMPGELILEAAATDSGNQTVVRTARYTIANADGSSPFSTNLTGGSAAGGDQAPRAQILTPPPGTVSTADLEVIATVTGDAVSSWSLEYAPVDLIDPQALAADDPDYVELATGSGEVFSDVVGTLPLSTLADGIYFVRLSADSPGGGFARFGQVVARNVAEETLRPLVTITSPQDGEAVSMTVDITGSIESDRPLTQWRVEYARTDRVDLNNIGLDDPDWVLLTSGTDPIAPVGVIANFDATLLRNNSYVLRVIARNDLGLGWVEPLLLEVTGDAKLGRNRLEFDDIDIDLNGFPLRFTRVYDSLNADRSGDFGFGWSLRLADTDIGETVPTTGVLGLFGSTPFRVGTRVYITAPSGERLAFTFGVEAGNPSALGVPYRAVFTPDPGNYFDLAVPEGDSAFLRLKEDGNVYLFTVALPYNPSRYVLTGPDGVRYTAHETRGLIGAEDTNGNTLTLNRDRIAHSAGPALDISRDAQGRITAVSDPDGNTWRYVYDGNGDLVESIDPDDNMTSYVYSVVNPHYLDTIMDPQGRMPRRFEYDPDTGRITAQIDENGNRREVNIDPAGFSGSTTDTRGNVSQYQYNARGNLISIEDPDGNTVSYEYDDPDNPDLQTRFEDASGEQWRYTYNDRGRPTRLTPPLASGSVNRFVIEYDELGNVTRFVRPDGGASQFTYDDAGNRLTEAPFAGLDTTYLYGPDGQVEERQVNNGYRQYFEYDGRGFVLRRSDAAGEDTTFTLLDNGRASSRTSGDDLVDVSYTGAGLLNTQTDADGNTVTVTENLDGAITRTDRTGRSTRTEFDAAGRPVRITLPEGGQVATAYDGEGNPTRVTDPLGNEVDYQYSFANLVTRVEDPLDRPEVFTRDANGNVTELVDRNGRRRTFEWDANRRLVAERWLDGSDAVIREIAYTYSASFGLRRVDETFGGETYSQVFSGRVPQVTHVDYELPGQEEWRVAYAWSGQSLAPRRVETGIRASVQAVIESSFFGNQTSSLTWRHPNGQGNRVDIVRNGAGFPVELRRFTGDSDGGATSVTQLSYGAEKWPQLIRHVDGADVLLHPNAELTYTRDEEGRVLTETHAGNTTGYTYDGNGQVTGVTHTAYVNESYTYDAAGNRLTSQRAPTSATIAPANRVTASGDFTYDFDDAGNLTRRSNTVTGEVAEYAYDHRNRLIEAVLRPAAAAPATYTATMEYDYRNRLLFRVINGVKTWVLHDREMPVAEFADGAATLSTALFYDPAQLDDWYGAWRDDAVGERWFLKDQQGSIRGVTDAGFGALSWVDYDTFGNLQAGATPVSGEELGYAGRPFNADLGLYDNRRRFYDPTQGRFTQEDPTGHGGRDFNFYRYAINSPTGFTDPTGEISSNLYRAIVGAVVGQFISTVDGKVTGGNRPCAIASWSASNFGYFDPLAEIILDPSLGSEAPNLEPVNLLEGTQCDSGE